MKSKNDKVIIEIDRETLEPTVPVPTRKHHALLFQIALLCFGLAAEAGRGVDGELVEEVTERLRAIRKDCLDDLCWDETLVRGVRKAAEAELAGRNNLLCYHAQRGGDHYALRV